MKSLTEYLYFNTKSRRAYLNITPQVEKLVEKSSVKDGLCLVNAMHITASVYINDDEDGLVYDFDRWLEELAPYKPTSRYRHNLTAEDNADAHLKRQIIRTEGSAELKELKGQVLNREFSPLPYSLFPYTSSLRTYSLWSNVFLNSLLSLSGNLHFSERREKENGLL